MISKSSPIKDKEYLLSIVENPQYKIKCIIGILDEPERKGTGHWFQVKTKKNLLSQFSGSLPYHYEVEKQIVFSLDEVAQRLKGKKDLFVTAEAFQRFIASAR